MGKTQRRQQQQQQLSGILVSVFLLCMVLKHRCFMAICTCVSMYCTEKCSSFYLLYSSSLSCKQKCFILFEFQKTAAPSITLCVCVNLDRCARGRVRWKKERPPARQRWINALKELENSAHIPKRIKRNYNGNDDDDDRNSASDKDTW